jgi:hypothetical protein
MEKILRAAVLSTALILGVAGAGVARAAAAPNTKAPCFKDVDAFCSNMKSGILKCLVKHSGRLSRTCQPRVDQYTAGKQKAKAACAQELQTLCASAAGWDQIEACAEAHSGALSPACAEGFASVKKAKLVILVGPAKPAQQPNQPPAGQ